MHGQYKLMVLEAWPLFELIIFSTALPGVVQQLAVTSPSDSNDTLTISWNQASGVVSQYYIVVTNYSLIPVTSFSVAGDQTTTTVPGLRKLYDMYSACVAIAVCL